MFLITPLLVRLSETEKLRQTSEIASANVDNNLISDSEIRERNKIRYINYNSNNSQVSIQNVL